MPFSLGVGDFDTVTCMLQMRKIGSRYLTYEG